MQLEKQLTGIVFVVVIVFFFCGEVWGATAVEEWVARYNGPADGWDEAYAIAVDDACNVYVTGGSYGSGPAPDYATIKYSPDSNTPVWVARYNGPGNFYDVAYDIAVDNSGNIYVTGRSDGSGPNGDYATIRYTAGSNIPVWVARYDGPGNNGDDAQGVAVDNSGNIYVTGGSWDSSTNYDYATIRYSTASSTPVWIARYNGPGNDWDFAHAIAADGSGNIYVTGETFNGTDLDYATVKYTTDSNTPAWVAIYDGPADGNDVAYDIAIDNSGNVYVTGGSDGIGTGGDCTTIKYAPGSNIPVWVARYNGPGNGWDQGNAIAVDNSGNIYVTGESEGSGTNQDYVTIKYGPDSNTPVWVDRYNGPRNDLDSARGIDTDNSGNVYVTGSSYGSGTDYCDYATIKYSSSSSTPLWIARYNNDDDWACAVAVDNSGNAYVTGQTHVTGPDADFATVKYSYAVCTSPVSGDLDNNCKVDFFDFAVFSRNWLECNLNPQSACWE